MHQLGKLTKNFVVLDSCNDNKRLSILFLFSRTRTQAVHFHLINWRMAFLSHNHMIYHDSLKRYSLLVLINMHRIMDDDSNILLSLFLLINVHVVSRFG